MNRRQQRIERSHAPARLVLAGFVGLAIGGCAGVPTPSSDDASAGTVPYVGVFTGEFVDGRPLYRLPTIEVVGSRTRAAPGT